MISINWIFLITIDNKKILLQLRIKNLNVRKNFYFKIYAFNNFFFLHRKKCFYVSSRSLIKEKKKKQQKSQSLKVILAKSVEYRDSSVLCCVSLKHISPQEKKKKTFSFIIHKFLRATLAVFDKWKSKRENNNLTLCYKEWDKETSCLKKIFRAL